MNPKNILTDEIKDLDKPLQSGLFNLFKGKKMQCRIIYEDGSYCDFFKKFGEAYKITIKKRDYMVIPDCICRGKHPFIAWYFNNPMPIKFNYQHSKLSSLSLIEKDKREKMDDKKQQILANITMDSEALHSIFTTKVLQGLYVGSGFLTPKVIMIFVIFFIIILLVLLQLTGTVDIIGSLNSIAGGK